MLENATPMGLRQLLVTAVCAVSLLAALFP
jgi:hypothetical protein